MKFVTRFVGFVC